ncbi:ribonuclease HI family protein [Rheinheimera hassiensis]|uniref:ribonuclease HI family protein n=1 Tax=Rheinheimera hassiensis TaxID=1193627 RepID=UPI001F05DEEE|nr:ribonuclease HI family protein [Rheinheimera hassiensis]
MQYSGHFDGSALSNPGPIGLGAVIFADGAEINSASVPRKPGTNNEAEYQALILLLKRALKAGIREIACFGDSKLVVEQVNGRWAINKPELKAYYTTVTNLIRQFNHVSIEWVKREKNARADELSRMAHKVSEPVFVENSPRPACTNETQRGTSVSANETGMAIRMLSRNSILIVEGSSNCILTIHPTNPYCSCPKFLVAKACRHIDAFTACRGSLSPHRLLSLDT